MRKLWKVGADIGARRVRRMNNKETSSTIEKMKIIASKLGAIGCETQAIEEMSELTKAICKMHRFCGVGQPVDTDADTVRQNIFKEIVDVRMSLYLYELTLNPDKDEEEYMIELYKSKVDRCYERLGCTMSKEEAIKECKPPTNDWEEYADKLWNIAYKRGWNDAKESENMGLTIEVDNNEDLCNLMCNNMIPQRSKLVSEEEALNYLKDNIDIFGGKLAESMAVAIQSLEKEIEIIKADKDEEGGS